MIVTNCIGVCLYLPAIHAVNLLLLLICVIREIDVFWLESGKARRSIEIHREGRVVVQEERRLPQALDLFLGSLIQIHIEDSEPIPLDACCLPSHQQRARKLDEIRITLELVLQN
ncbi:hypothetical protein BT93_B1984 [Corymbia citriodora subsp. variegata]|nr:hypothetical protein BT93_B1984 [Corymbia citriodora subsp. variegata]